MVSVGCAERAISTHPVARLNRRRLVAMAYFDVHGSIVHPNHPPGDWQRLCQRGELVFPEEEGGERQGGVRFIWLTANGKLSSRPCRIDSIHDIVTLLTLALD